METGAQQEMLPKENYLEGWDPACLRRNDAKVVK